MTIARRIVAAFSALLLQLLLLGSSLPCPMQQEMAHGGGAPSHAMQAMAAEMPAGCDGAGHGGACGGPLAPGPCASMIACGQTVAPPALSTAPVVGTRASAEPPEPSILRSALAASPELPPPRA